MVFPKFKLEQSYDLIDNLKEMGLTDLFEEKGDFTGMTSEKIAINWVNLPSRFESHLKNTPIFTLIYSILITSIHCQSQISSGYLIMFKYI